MSTHTVPLESSGVFVFSGSEPVGFSLADGLVAGVVTGFVVGAEGSVASGTGGATS